MESPVDKMAAPSFYNVFSDLLEGIKDIQTVVPNASILPDWIFFHRNALKIVHF